MQVGTIAGWLTLIAVMSVAWVGWRGGGSTAISTLETTNRVLEKRVQELENTVATDARTIADLKASRDFATAVQPLMDALAAHEVNSESREARHAEALERLIVTLTITGHTPGA